jgi:hypothetical protein
MPKSKLPPRPDRVKIREQWAAEKAAYIERLVDTAPPLSAEQKDRLVVVLRTGRTPDGEAA